MFSGILAIHLMKCFTSFECFKSHSKEKHRNIGYTITEEKETIRPFSVLKCHIHENCNS